MGEEKAIKAHPEKIFFFCIFKVWCFPLWVCLILQMVVKSYTQYNWNI